MKPHHLQLLCDPYTRDNLTLEEAIFAGDEIVSGILRSARRTWPIIRPRFQESCHPSDQYTRGLEDMSNASLQRGRQG